MNTLIKALVVSTSLVVASSASALVGFGFNPASPLQGYVLGDGQYATLIGLQSTNSLVGQTIGLADLNAAILSGTVSGFYYAAGNPSSATFQHSSIFAPFVSDTIVAGAGNPGQVWDSLYAVHTGTVYFSNGSTGITTMSTGGTRIQQNPFTTPLVPDNGAPVALLGAVFVGLAIVRRKLVA